jgi:hypothetical protein
MLYQEITSGMAKGKALVVLIMSTAVSADFSDRMFCLSFEY